MHDHRRCPVNTSAASPKETWKGPRKIDERRAPIQPAGPAVPVVVRQPTVVAEGETGRDEHTEAEQTQAQGSPWSVLSGPERRQGKPERKTMGTK